MRIAVFGDIHGNSIGLDAVLNDIDAQGGVDAYWLLGDYCFGGADVTGTLERLSDLENAVFIRGNGDHYLFNPTLPTLSELPPEQHDWLVEITRDQYWTIGALSQGPWLKWMADLPVEYRCQLPSGERVLLVHSFPGSDGNPGLYPTHSDEIVRGMFGSADESLIFVGHTHSVQDQILDGKRIINVGCVGKPAGRDTRATYAILEADETSYSIEFAYVEYDTEAVIQQLLDFGYPGTAYMMPFYRGEYVPSWAR